MHESVENAVVVNVESGDRARQVDAQGKCALEEASSGAGGIERCVGAIRSAKETVVYGVRIHKEPDDRPKRIDRLEEGARGDAGTWISASNIGLDPIGAVAIFSALGFEDFMRDASVREGERNVPLSKKENDELMKAHRDAVIYEEPS